MTLKSNKKEKICPPSQSKNLITDIINFLINKPNINTKVQFQSEEARAEYNKRVMQRVGIDIEKYAILNIHKIGINAPSNYVFNELLSWNGDSTCWPNHIAKVNRQKNKIDEIAILPFGWKKYPLGFKKSFFGFHFIPLFCLEAIKIKNTPDSFDFDNARYILYKCTGGYPIGIFAMYVRSSLPELEEKGESQLIFAVSFNFYGKKVHKYKYLNKIWEAFHNRVTANVLNRMKQLSEWRLYKIQKKIEFL